MNPEHLARSEALHARVRRFARWSLGDAQDAAGLTERQRDGEAAADVAESFEDLARDIAEYQAEVVFTRDAPSESPSGGVGNSGNIAASLPVPVRGLVAPGGGAARTDATSALAAPAQFDGAPALFDWAPALTPTPVDVFRVRDIFAFDASAAGACFVTSGTTGAQSGRHWMRTLETYSVLSELWGRGALLPASSSGAGKVNTHVVALMPDPGAAPTSSLGFMAAHFMQRFETHVGLRAVAASERWLLRESGVDVDRLRSAASRARDHGATLTVLATSFALVMLLDALAGERLELPARSVVMLTGGYKGRTREVPEVELRAELLRTFGAVALIGEYGMTELSSQLYDGVVPGAALVGPQGLYLPPPWLRVVPLDPVTLTPVPPGETGLAAFIDLGNVDSALCVLTQDLVRVEGAGVRLLGRRPRAPLRGCSLAVEALYEGNDSAWRAVSRNSAAQRGNASSAARATSESPNEPVRVVGAEATSSPAQTHDARRFARAARLREVARAIAVGTTAWGRRARDELPGATGLSPQAVELGLSRALEVNISDEQLEAFCRRAPRAERVWVVLSANVFTAPYRAIAWALASSEKVCVRPSRRDPVLARLLHGGAPELFELVSELAPRSGDHVHAYGSDETMDAVRESLPAGVTFWAHGSGLGAGLMLERGTEAESARGFALDSVLFEQRGCLSPRVIALGPVCDVSAFVNALCEALERWSTRVPRPAQSADERADQSWYERTARCVGDYCSLGAAGSVLTQYAAAHPLVPPPGRNLVVVPALQPATLLLSLGNVLTCVGAAGARAREEAQRLFTSARVVAPGAMQTPLFDGPVDLRVVCG